MRWFWRFLLVVMCLVTLASPALAHGGGVGAVIEVSPDVPPPGQATAMKLQLLDVLGATIPEAKVKVTVRPPGALVPQVDFFKEPESGLYTGNVLFPAPGMAVMRVEATLPDGLYLGEVTIEVGKYEVNGMVVSLTHQDAVGAPTAPAAPVAGTGSAGVPAATRSASGVLPWYRSPWVWAAALTLMAGGGAFLVGRRRRSR